MTGEWKEGKKESRNFKKYIERKIAKASDQDGNVEREIFNKYL